MRSATGSTHTRRVYISDDNGANWTQVADLDQISRTFGQVVIDLADAASNNGLVLNDQFRVIFFYDDYYSRGSPGDGMIIDDVRLLQRDQVLAAFPLTQEGFEDTTLPQGFYPLSFGSGTVEFSTDYAHSGSQGLFLGQNIGGGASARLSLPLDLTNQTEAFLSFQVRSTNGDTHTRRVYISDDNGANWTQVADLDRVSQNFSAVTIDLVEAASDNNLSLNDTFRVIFFYDDYYSRGTPGDGMVIDDLRITNTLIGNAPAGTEVYLPFIQR